MSNIVCIGCKTVKPEPPKVVIYYYNGKPVYNRNCSACQKAAWMKFRDPLELENEEVAK